MQCFSSTYSIASASTFYPSRPQKKSAKPSAFYMFENPQVRRSANLHFTGGPLCWQSMAASKSFFSFFCFLFLSQHLQQEYQWQQLQLYRLPRRRNWYEKLALKNRYWYHFLVPIFGSSLWYVCHGP